MPILNTQNTNPILIGNNQNNIPNTFQNSQFNNNLSGDIISNTNPNNNFNHGAPNNINSGFSDGNNVCNNHPNFGYMNNPNENPNTPANTFGVKNLERNNFIKLNNSRWMSSVAPIPFSNEEYEFSANVGYLESGELGIRINTDVWNKLVELRIITKDQKVQFEQVVLNNLREKYHRLAEQDKNNKWIFNNNHSQF